MKTKACIFVSCEKTHFTTQGDTITLKKWEKFKAGGYADCVLPQK